MLRLLKLGVFYLDPAMYNNKLQKNTSAISQILILNIVKQHEGVGCDGGPGWRVGGRLWSSRLP